MSYLTFHHNSFYFQIRVPTALAATFGPIVRINLQTSDRATARPIALRLASDWLSRFDEARGQVLSLPATTFGPSAVAIPSPTHAASMTEVVPYVGGAAPDSTELATSGQSTTRTAERATDSALFDTWKSIDRGREPSTVREMQASIREFRRFCKVPAPALSRLDVAGFRDHLLARGQARATVSKRVGFISTLLQVGFDAGVLTQNVARGLKIPRAKVPTLVRRVFTTDELKRIFGSEVYTRQFRPIAGGGEACAWLPMIALGVGIGVDYALYLLSIQLAQQRADATLAEAHRCALQFTGKVVALVGVTLAAGVVTWIWSPIKFQADMGILLTFMFVWNMVGALILIPALSHFLLKDGVRAQRLGAVPELSLAA